MDLCGPAVFFPEDGDLLLDPCQSLLLDQCSDAGYHSACGSSLSPTSSVDSCCLSPPAASIFGGFGGVQEIPECFGFLGDSVLSSEVAAEPVEETRPVRRGRKPRSKYPGKKRHSASEREKLRMRDLTKALHHLRTYLPTSVAPVGQTLTKIDTLRLTIRYIAHLSDQLGLSEETLTQRSPASDHHHQQQLRASSPLLHPANTHSQHPHNTPYSPPTAQQQHLQAFPQEQQLQTANLHFQFQQLQQLQPQAYSPAQEALPAHVSPQSGSLQHGFPLEHLPEHTHASYQNPCDITYAQGVCSIPQEYWAPPQNMFYGLC